MTTLSEKLASLTKENTVAELNKMLAYAQTSQVVPPPVQKFAHAHVSISWGGQRLVTVDGYEGSVEINELGLKYFSADPFQSDTQAALEDRLDCDNLWGRVQKLYNDSDAVLGNTSAYWLLVLTKELRPYSGCNPNDPMHVFLQCSFDYKKDSIFYFTKDEFKALWPNGEPRWKIETGEGGEASERWAARREFVEAALNKA